MLEKSRLLSELDDAWSYFMELSHDYPSDYGYKDSADAILAAIDYIRKTAPDIIEA